MLSWFQVFVLFSFAIIQFRACTLGLYPGSAGRVEQVSFLVRQHMARYFVSYCVPMHMCVSHM